MMIVAALLAFDPTSFYRTPSWKVNWTAEVVGVYLSGGDRSVVANVKKRSLFAAFCWKANANPFGVPSTTSARRWHRLAIVDGILGQTTPLPNGFVGKNAPFPILGMRLINTKLITRRCGGETSEHEFDPGSNMSGAS